MFRAGVLVGILLITVCCVCVCMRGCVCWCLCGDGQEGMQACVFYLQSSNCFCHGNLISNSSSLH